MSKPKDDEKKEISEESNLSASESETPSQEDSKQPHPAEQELLYLRAEFDNYRKRMERDKEQSIRYANEKVAVELLSLVDLFDRAMGFGKDLSSHADKVVQNFAQGIELTHKELIHTLTRMGVELVGEMGESFQPEKHEAISQQETENPEDDGKVLAVLSRGGILKGRLLKPAQVLVGKLKA